MRAHHAWKILTAAVVSSLTTTVGAAPAQASLGGSLPDVELPLPALGDGIVSTRWGDVLPQQERDAVNKKGRWAPARDVGSLYSLTKRTGIQAEWASGSTGEGVTVAVIDTGIAPVRGLRGRTKVVHGPDLSFDSQSPGARYVDGFGHGTHMAAIIGGRDPKWDPQSPRPRIFAGVAPDAQLLNLKVGAGDGGVDVSQVIAAINWAVEHRNKRGMNVRVISLAYGTATTQSWQVDPLARAVEDAQKAGIVVVAAAGNDGLDAPRLLMPAIDPHVIAVGAVDPNATTTVLDDTVADFTSGGSLQRRPDIVAPGRSIASLRVPGSYVDTMAPQGRIAADVEQRYFRGSGTSQATAFVAGQAALLLQQRPELTPAQVKALLVTTARPLTVPHPAMGAGESSAVRAAKAPIPVVLPTLPQSTGTGSLEASRGGAYVLDPLSGVALAGERDIRRGQWDGAAWAARSSAGTTWDGGRWNGRTWTGNRFVRNTWKAVDWAGRSWGGVPWSEHRTRATWVSGEWTGQQWEGRSWRQDSWKGRSWRSLY